MTVGIGPVLNGGLHMADMHITQAAGARNYSLHWRDGHITGFHPTVHGSMTGNHSMTPAPNTPHYNWGIDFNGTISASPFVAWGVKGIAPDPCSWITFCTSCCAKPGPECCCVTPGAPPLPPPGDCGSVKHHHPCDTAQPRVVHWCKHPFCPYKLPPPPPQRVWLKADDLGAVHVVAAVRGLGAAVAPLAPLAGTASLRAPNIASDRRPDTFAVPVVTAASSISFAVEGDTQPLEVSGFGVAATSAGAPLPRCRISPLAGESGFVHVSGYLADPRSVIEFNATVLHANKSCPKPCYSADGIMDPCCFATLRCEPPPSVLVPGPGLLSVRNNVGYSTNPFEVAYELLVDVALDRRPYLAEPKARLLLRAPRPFADAAAAGGLTVVASLPDLPSAASAGWRHQNVSLRAGGAVLELPFAAALPPLVNADLRVDITLAASGRTITKWRRFMRAPPAAAATVEPVQVDHDRRGLLVGGQAFVGSGWYVDGNDEPTWRKNLSNMAAAIAMQAKVGDNQVMPYGLSTHFSAAEQRAFMDEMQRLGVKVLYPLAPSVPKAGSAASALNARHLDRAVVSEEWWGWVRGNVSIVANHTALLGYYICDDCCPFAPNSQPIGNSRLYNQLKAQDPYHLTFGAIQCTDAWMWSDVPSNLQPSAPVEDPVIPFEGGAHQPRLQLSLDVVLWEHYGDILQSIGRRIPFPGGPFPHAPHAMAADPVAIRYGAWWEPIYNCHGLWYLGSFNDYPATPRATKSALWLSVLTADMPLQLTFVLEANSWSDPAAVEGVDGGWPQTAAVSAWAAEARLLASSFFPSFGAAYANGGGGGASAMVVVETASLLRGAAVAPDMAPIRARAWSEACGPGKAFNSSGLCIHVIVVNLAQDSPASFTLRLSPGAIAGKAQFPLVASRLFDSGGYDVETTFDGLIVDFIGAGDSVVYEIGCNGVRYNAAAGNASSSTSFRGGIDLDALSCSNRRVECVHGFVKTDPRHARCAPRTRP